MSRHRRLAHRPSSITCEGCRAEVEVKPRGPLPRFCSACSPRSTQGRQHRARVAEAIALGDPTGALPEALARAVAELAATEDPTSNTALTAQARVGLALAMHRLRESLPILAPHQLPPATKALLGVLETLSGDSIGMDFATLNVVIGRGAARDPGGSDQ